MLLTCSYFHHNTFTTSGKKRCDEDKEDVIQQQRQQQNGANLQVRKSYGFNQGDTETDTKEILHNPCVTVEIGIDRYSKLFKWFSYFGKCKTDQIFLVYSVIGQTYDWILPGIVFST